MKYWFSALVYIFLLLTPQSTRAATSEKFSTLNDVKDTLYKWSQNENIRFAAKTAAVAGASIAAAPLVLSAAGFGAAGVAAGSAAAGAQAMFLGGSVSGVGGAVFATLQSFGAAGLGIGAKSAIVGASAATVKLYENVKSKFYGEEEPKKKSWYFF